MPRHTGSKGNRGPQKRTIIKLLKQGVQPEHLPGAVTLGGGCFRTAYRVGRYVVKDNSDDFHQPRSIAERELQRVKVPLALAPTTYLRTQGARFVIQPFYTQVFGCGTRKRRKYDTHVAPVVRQWAKNDFTESWIDIHDANTGIDNKGNLVLYDW